MFSLGLQEHLHHLRLVLEVLRQHSLKVNQKKCTFGKVQHLPSGLAEDLTLLTGPEFLVDSRGAGADLEVLIK